MARPPAGGRCLVLSISREACWSRRRYAALLTILVFLACPALAQLPPEPPDAAAPARDQARRNVWLVTPSLTVAETYTDNLFLVPDELRQGDWVTQIVPAISVKADGPRLRLEASYAPELVHYARTEGQDKVYQRGTALGNLELAEKLLFVEAGAGVGQYAVSLQGPLTTSNVNITGNRANAATTYVSPYLLRDIGSAARAEARFTYSTWHSDAEPPPLPDNIAHRVYLQLTNGPAYRYLTWDMVYSRESIQYETGQQTTSEYFTASGQPRITGNVRLLTLVGYERYDTGIQVLEDPRWSAGFEWTPTPLTRLALTGGRRLDDPTYSLQFSHRTRLSTWNLSYGEEVTTARSQFFVPATQSTANTLDQMLLYHYPDPVARQKVVQDFIGRTGLSPSLGTPINFFTDQLFLQKMWQASVGLQGTRNTLIATAFWQERNDLAASTATPVDDFAISQSIRTNGGTLVWSLRSTPRNLWSFQAGRYRSQFRDTGQVDDFTYFRAGLSRQFQPHLSGAVYYRRQVKDSTQGAAAEYREDSAIASLLMTF